MSEKQAELSAKQLTQDSQSNEGNGEVGQNVTLKAAGFMLMGSTSMAVMNVFAKLVKNQTNITALQMGAFRFLIMALGCFIHARCTNVKLTVFPGNTRVWILPRAIGGYLSSMG